MGSTLVVRQAETRLDTKREELIALSGDIDAFVWEIEEALREARQGDPDAEVLQRLDVRAANLLAAMDKVRTVLPPRIADVMTKAPAFKMEPGAINLYDTHRYMK